MSTTVTISPLTRIEGHLAIHTETEPIGSGDAMRHRVTSAECRGEMFRGFEQILVGRDPLDAQQITQRICGVCPISHATASVRAQEMAYGITPSKNGRLLQNLILAANYLQSHILHFYQLAALDFVDVTAVLGYGGSDRGLQAVKSWVKGALDRKDTFAGAPFLPRYNVDYVKDGDRNVALLAHYVESLEMRRTCHEMASIFGARLPHSTAIFPGGVTEIPTMERVLSYTARLQQVISFVESVYIPDLLEVAKEFPEYFDIGQSYGNYLSFGVFETNAAGEKFIGPGTVIEGKWEQLDPRNIAEDVSHARYSGSDVRHPSDGDTVPDASRARAYSWVKAPRYKGKPMEVGPLARVAVNYFNPGGSWIKGKLDAVLGQLNLPLTKLNSVLGRHVARGLEAQWIGHQVMQWLDEIDIDAPATTEFELPRKAQGYGLTEAPRGALGHWLAIEDHRVLKYQCVVPTTWNCSPRDNQGQPGPVEKAIEETEVKDPAQPIEVGRVVRSFDPCLACAVH